MHLNFVLVVVESSTANRQFQHTLEVVTKTTTMTSENVEL